MFQKTTAQAKISALRGRVRVVQGGTSASKTYSILPLLISFAVANKNLEISIVSETFPHLRRGAFRDFEKIMRATAMWQEDSYNRGDKVYRFKNGSFIEFFSADQEGKVLGARRDILFVNEANNLRWETFHQLHIRTRLFTYIDFNPANEFWAHTELEQDPSVQWLTLTYKDNEATPPEVVKDLERAIQKAEKSLYWKNWVRVYVYGQVGILQGTIFPEHEAWHQVKEIPKEAKRIGYGLDFGYTNDPTAVVEVFYLDQKYYLNEVVYETKLTNPEIAKKLKSHGLKERGWADSAEPKSIKEINEQGGIDLIGADKGPDSIRYGISTMHEIGPFYVTEGSLNLIQELRKYSWEKDKKGLEGMNAKTNKPIDAWNHGIDAVRYFFMMHISKPKREASAKEQARRPRHSARTL